MRRPAFLPKALRARCLGGASKVATMIATMFAIMMSVFGSGSARAENPHRFALVAGNDQGGPGTRPLLYAKDDARKVFDILTRLGNVRGEDALLLLDGDVNRFLNALAELERRAAEATRRGEKTALVVYYSGHAKDGALRLGNSELPLQTLKARLAQAAVDVRIGIFDSCQSGAMTRTKGARKAPAFEIDTKGPRSAQGTVILTSSAADEDSQESDQIRGSYFSHHLASGLLGGADKSGDGRVTLSEAYAYAYDRTVADTADSSAGAQHPTFSYDLSGNGDLVLTDVGGRHEGVYFPGDAPTGTYFLVDNRGFVVAEIAKALGSDRRIALPPGRYRIKRRLPDRLRVGDVEVPRGQLVAFSEPMLRDTPFSDDPVKGAARDLSVDAHWSIAVGGAYQAVLSSPSDGLFPAATFMGLDVGLRDFFRRDWVWGLDGAIGRASSQVALPSGAVFPYQFGEVSIASSLVVEARPHGQQSVLPRWMVPFVGVRVAMLMMSRRFDDQLFPDQFFATISPGLVAGLGFALGEHVSLVTRGRLHYLLYNVEQTNRSFGTWEASAFLQYDFGGSQ